MLSWEYLDGMLFFLKNAAALSRDPARDQTGSKTRPARRTMRAGPGSLRVMRSNREGGPG